MKNLRKLLAKMNERIGKMSASELINRIERDKSDKIDFEIVDAIETLINEYNNLKQIKEAYRIENGKLREKINKIEKYVRGNEWSEDYKNSSCRTSILRILEED